MNMQLNVKFNDGTRYDYTFRTGLCSSMVYDDQPLVYLKDLFEGELTEHSRNEFDKLVSQHWWKEAILKHDLEIISRKEIFILNLKEDLTKLDIKGE